MQKKIQCVIFDLDGTLIDSGPDLLDSLNYVLSKNSLEPIEQRVLGNLVGGGAEAMIRKGYNYLKKELPEKSINSLVKCFLEFYYLNCTKKTRLYKNVQHVLDVLKVNNFKIGLCTNKKQHLAEKILNEIKIAKFFDIIVGSTPNMKLKPDPEMLLYCLKKLDFAPDESLMVGDSINDILPANKLRMISIFVKFGYGTLNDDYTPNFKIDNLVELLKILEVKS
tara:strand:- start:70 stop:738 length:669 start_codon:yes stop_codon:yes gene_type:complete